jgi:peptidoglycan/LPS O-acetylase OafA/YrhL
MFFPELQSLRGLAALFVLLGHGIGMYAEPEWVYRAALVFNGRGAVIMFFVLSGCVLTQSLAGAPLSLSGWMRFMIRRVARIYPAIWVISSFALVYVLTIHQSVRVPDASVAFLARYRMTRLNVPDIILSYLGLLPFLVPQLWTITVEMAASVAIPVLAWLRYRRRRVFFIVALAALAISFAFGPDMPFAIGTLVPAFVAGAWLAQKAKPTGLPVPERHAGWTVLVYVGCCAFPFTQYLPLPYADPLAALAETAVAAAIIGPIVSGRADVTLLRARPLVFLGDISYSLYLVHYLILSVLLKVFAATGLLSSLAIEGAWKPVFLDAMTVPLAVIISYPLYRFVELPGARFGKRLARGLLPRAGDTPARGQTRHQVAV